MHANSVFAAELFGPPATSRARPTHQESSAELAIANNTCTRRDARSVHDETGDGDVSEANRFVQCLFAPAPPPARTASGGAELYTFAAVVCRPPPTPPVSPRAVLLGAAKRARTNEEGTTGPPPIIVEQMPAVARAPRRARPSREEWRAEQLLECNLRDTFFGAGHKCRTLQASGDACHLGLWGQDVEQLRKHLQLCLPAGNVQGDATTSTSLSSRRSQVLHHLVAVNEDRADGQFVYMVNGRLVCAPIFARHWGLSHASLERLVAEAKLIKGGMHVARSSAERKPRDAVKRDYVVAWVRQYAELVTEKLPDCRMLLIPRVSWLELHREFEADLQAAGVSDACCTVVHFRQIFKTSDELKDVGMNRHKRNFGKCAQCVELNAEVTSAIKGNDPSRVQLAKNKRLEHYGLAKADKMNYYAQREVARQRHSVKMTLIIDKMDSAKNHIPWYSNGRKPKDAEDLLKDALKLHITGVIVHGRPDKRYLYWSLPFLPGNANLNLECMRRALLHALRESGAFRPKLYLQMDNASDNKNYTVFVLLAWLVHQDYVSQVELCMMMVGHTHEDIDAMFRFIADKLRSKGVVRTIDELVACARAAFPDNIHVEHIPWVPNYTEWLKDCRGEFMDIKSERYFVMSKRADGVVAMWDATILCGDWSYTASDEGIEVLGRLPAGHPRAQPFEADRLDVEAMCSLVEQIIDLHPTQFEEVRPWWRNWRDTCCRNVHDAVRMFPLEFTWPEKCAALAPCTLDGLRSEYLEGMRYRNSVGRENFNRQALEQAREEERVHAPPLKRGDLLILKAPPSTASHDATPFWVGEVHVDEVPASQNDIPSLMWYSCFKNGVAQPDPSGAWKPVCIGHCIGRAGVQKFHCYGNGCQHQGRPREGHGPYLSAVERSSVVLYGAKLSPKSCTLTMQTKRELWKLRQCLNTNGGIPPGWRANQQ